MTSANPASRVPVTVVVLTFNEERNLARCLESVSGWAAQITVVDSGSTDQTLAIAERHGARIVTHPFDTHARQWAWALASVPMDTEWVLGLDADQVVTPGLRAEIERRLDPARGSAARGYYVRRRQIFRGRWIRHGGYYPKHLLKLFHRAHVSIDVDELVDHHFHVDGPTAVLGEDLIEDNRNESDIAVWTAKHNRYAVLQARQELRALDGPKPRLRAIFGTPDDRTRYLKTVWSRLPLFVRPCLYFAYRYVVRLGFLDGKEGFVFHVLQGFWYRLLVDINIDELRRVSEAARRDVPSLASTAPERQPWSR
jgi:glycosyltransferase involved in cell wall biosynthesis